jgi:hypothetical protein
VPHLEKTNKTVLNFREQNVYSITSFVWLLCLSLFLNFLGEAKKAKGESFVEEKAEKEKEKEKEKKPQQQQNRGNRRDFDGHVDTQSRKNPQQFEQNEQPRGGRGPKPGREFDRHSQNGQSRKYVFITLI